jgi:hypothetical protein
MPHKERNKMGDSIENIEPLNRLEKIRLSPPPSRADGM